VPEDERDEDDRGEDGRDEDDPVGQPPSDPKRPADSDVIPPVDDTIGFPPTYRVGVVDIVNLGGRPAALDDLVRAAYEAHERELFGCALRATRDREVAADLVQETFLRLVAELRAGRRPERLRAWLYRVLSNLIVSRGRHVSVVDRWRSRLRGSEDAAPPPELAAVASETRRALEHAVAKLAPDARLALMLAAKGFTGPEIASQLGRSQAATRTLLCRARMQVRAMLSDDDA
jgi:RNA polymerase sigma-70 factor (ECF subfamily)